MDTTDPQLVALLTTIAKALWLLVGISAVNLVVSTFNSYTRL